MNTTKLIETMALAVPVAAMMTVFPLAGVVTVGTLTVLALGGIAIIDARKGSL